MMNEKHFLCTCKEPTDLCLGCNIKNTITLVHGKLGWDFVVAKAHKVKENVKKTVDSYQD